MTRLRLSIIVLLSGLLSLLSPVLMATDDTRILIDVSGSMKKTDPDNLRVPALKLLNRLLPTGSKAGVWYFGRYVDTSVRWGTVNDQWRKAADKGATNLHSNGLFTNIESALERATRGWEKASPDTARNIILLTDGKVDISKDEAKNKKSHARILGDGIKKLKKSGARVYSIALSGNTDEVLLKKLALETGGFFERVEDAKALKKAFFKMFEKAVSPDSIELDGNQFTVDKSIKEITMLIFKKNGAAPVNLYPPANEVLTAQRPGKAKWISDESYELITINKPTPGVWTLEAETDENARLMVVTDLSLKTRGLPAYAMPSDELNFVAELHNRSKMIKKNSFLRFVDFKVKHMGPEGDARESKLPPAPGYKNKGEYPFQLKDLQEGSHEIVVTAESRTFNRSQRIHLQVQWPAIVDVTPSATIGEFDITLTPRDEMLKPETFKPSVSLIAPDKSELAVLLTKTGNQWAGLIKTGQAGMYQALVEFEAQDLDGKSRQFDQGAYTMLGVLNQSGTDQKVVDEGLAIDEDSNHETSDQAAKAQPAIDWLKVGLIVGAVNLVLAIIAGVFFFLGRRRKRTDYMLGDDEPVEDHESELLEQA